MTDQRVGAAIRAVRIRRRWRQLDLAIAAGVSRATVSRLERGHLGSLSVESVRRLASALDIRIDLVPRWRGGDLDRLLNARHSALGDQVTRTLVALPGWIVRPEASFSIYGERGVVDALAWHRPSDTLLVIELKTDIADVNDLVGTVDRKRRLAVEIAREQGWAIGRDPSVSAWVIVAAGRTNRRRVQAHAALLRAAFPRDGRGIAGWLRSPSGPIRCLSFWPEVHRGNARADLASVRRVRRPRARSVAA